MHSLAFALMLTIRLYASADTSTADIAAAKQSAEVIFHQALVEVDWTDCRTAPKKPRPLTCDHPLQDSEVAMRLVSVGPSRTVSDTLGDAVVDTTTHDGSLATIYVDRVTQLALAAKTPAGQLLGRVIAHEVGHLLLGSTEHPLSGVMRGQWPRRVVADCRDHDWTFSDDESRLMRERLAIVVDHQPTGTPAN